MIWNEVRTLAPVAQWIEHRSSEPRVVGSNPAGRAIFQHINAKETALVISRFVAFLSRFLTLF